MEWDLNYCRKYLKNIGSDQDGTAPREVRVEFRGVFALYSKLACSTLTSR